ncbi:hypothetical protein NL108_001087 [Boleophthalmus pectinirostris]|nr:hypothetical protein NL108_001087 [Boleophthalmus pectinirostris]
MSFHRLQAFRRLGYGMGGRIICGHGVRRARRSRSGVRGSGGRGPFDAACGFNLYIIFIILLYCLKMYRPSQIYEEQKEKHSRQFIMFFTFLFYFIIFVVKLSVSS